MVTREGYPLGYEIFDGNCVDVTTVQEIVEAMEGKHGRANRVWVMDRGMVSEDNLTWLRDGGRKYLVGTPRSELRKRHVRPTLSLDGHSGLGHVPAEAEWEGELLERRGWQEIREGLEVKLCAASCEARWLRQSARFDPQRGEGRTDHELRSLPR